MTNVRGDTGNRIPSTTTGRLCGHNRGYVAMLTLQDFILYATFIVVVVIWAEVKGLDRDD